MIYYASSHKEGAETLAKKHDLRPIPSNKYVSEDSLKIYTGALEHHALFDAIQVHPAVHAYVLLDLTLHFHPDNLLELIGVAYQKYFKSFA